MFLYRAVDSQGNTREFLLSPTLDAEAAKRFFSADGTLPDACELRQSTYLNNLVEQDQRAHQTAGQARDRFLFVRGRVAHSCRGYEAMNMLRKGQIYSVDKRDSRKQMACIASLFGVAVSR
jgi:IS6 family transposase